MIATGYTLNGEDVYTDVGYNSFQDKYFAIGLYTMSYNESLIFYSLIPTSCYKDMKGFLNVDNLEILNVK